MWPAPHIVRGCILLAIACSMGEMPRSACLPDGLELTVSRGPGDSEVTLRWAGADPGFELYASEDPAAVVAPENLLVSTEEREWIDGDPTGTVRFYSVRSSSSLQQIGFESQGPDGDFDLDLGVPGAVRRGRTGAYGAYSWVAPGEESFVLVRTELGFIDAAAPRCVEAVAAVNDVSPASDPELGELLWVHEVPTVTWQRETGEWELFYLTYPEDSSGERLFGYSWIAHKSMENLPSPDAEPDLGTLDGKEQRLFAGLAYDDRLTGSTGDWAQGEPIDPVPLNTKYIAYSEPGAYAEGGKVYLALTAVYCPQGNCEGDVILLRSDDGESWDYLGVMLTADDAKPFGLFFSYFTAPAIFRNPDDDTLRLLVTPNNTFDIYQGLYEFQIEDLDAARILRDGQGRPIPRFELPPEGPLVHTGAGSYHHLLHRRLLGKHFPGEPGRFRIFTYEP